MDLPNTLLFLLKVLFQLHPYFCSLHNACLLEYMKVREQALKFWEEGDPDTEWLTITEEDMQIALPQNRDPLPVGGVQKRPPLVKTGTC